MIHKNKKFDIAVVGAGPAGIAFACGFIGSNIKVAIIDKLPKKVIANPKIDGREIALTHHSVKDTRVLLVQIYTNYLIIYSLIQNWINFRNKNRKVGTN